MENYIHDKDWLTSSLIENNTRERWYIYDTESYTKNFVAERLKAETVNNLLFLKANRKLWNVLFVLAIAIWNEHGDGGDPEDINACVEED